MGKFPLGFYYKAAERFFNCRGLGGKGKNNRHFFLSRVETYGKNGAKSVSSKNLAPKNELRATILPYD